ncbi:MAG: ribulose-phosphate 3-epimerase [Erysipelotrichaceae bacterium]|nr:MAG: ribulose-phosphate 3-epimerase [Erysipelotrichaceae bacterium]
MKSKLNIVPSIASSNLINVQRELERIGDDYESLHIDIEDGNFIPNITFGLSMIRALRSATSKPFSVHLMVSDPAKYLDDLFNLNCSHIFIHVESSQYLREMLFKIKQANIKAGIALNPISKIESYEYLLDDVDCILYMTCEPDGRQQIFNPKVLDNIKIYPNIRIWVDGGIKLTMLNDLEKMGISTIVLGREIFNNQDPKSLLSEINK